VAAGRGEAEVIIFDLIPSFPFSRGEKGKIKKKSIYCIST
jgi:hypothetical protein